MLDGHSILEYDLNAMAEKPWRRPGSDLSDWFNYGFDEMTWQMFCNQRQNMVEHAGMLKTNVLVRRFCLLLRASRTRANRPVPTVELLRSL